MRVKKEKCYLVVSKKNGYIQGAFPYSDDGKERASEYLKKINENKDFEIKEG